MVRLFLDDIRIPVECAEYMKKRIGKDADHYKEDWVTVRNYEEFVDYLHNNDVPQIVSFDHDLAHEHYAKIEFNPENYSIYTEDFKEKTGNDCAKFLVNFCRNKEVSLPECFVHSMNPVGIDNILNSLKYA